MAVQVVSTHGQSSQSPPPRDGSPGERAPIDLNATQALLREMQRHYDVLTTLVAELQRQFFAEDDATHETGADQESRPLPPSTVGGSRSARYPFSSRRLAEVLFESAIEEARLDGALLAARTAAHLINNDLTAAVGLIGIIRRRLLRGDTVDPPVLDEAIASARNAAKHLRDLQNIVRLELEDGPDGAPLVLDLKLSRRLMPARRLGQRGGQQGRKPSTGKVSSAPVRDGG